MNCNSCALAYYCPYQGNRNLILPEGYEHDGGSEENYGEDDLGQRLAHQSYTLPVRRSASAAYSSRRTILK
jgi:hypothetical protein